MPKAILSNRIYLDTSPEVSLLLKASLTYRIPKPPRPGMTRFSSFEIVKNYKIISKGIYSIPIGRMDLIPKDYEIIDKRTLHELPFPTPLIELREYQKPAFEEVDDSCFINALPGWGKTFVTLHIARKLGQKTLIVAHNTMLRDQWIEEIAKLYNMPVGIIGSGQFDIDHSIVVGNIQTLTKLAPRINKEFGTVIVDEAHHCPATTFTSFIDAMYARYKIGLSGTMARVDGKHILFKDFFGPKLLQPPASGTMTPKVQIINTGFSLPEGEIWAKKINTLLHDEDYQQFVATLTKVKMDLGHKVLVIADRVEFLIKIKELIGEKCVCITGGTDFEARKELKRQIEDGEKTCIAGSRQIFSEGISVDILSCVVLASPMSSPSLLEQIIGRVIREHPNKLQPIIMDMNFNGPSDRRQNKARRDFYTRKGWEVMGYKI